MLAQILHGSVRALLTDGSAPSRASADIKRFLYQPALSSIANCRSAISRHWRRSSRGSDEPEVNFVRRGDPIPAGHARLTQSEYEKATDGTLVLEFGTEKGQPIGAKEYVRRREAMRDTHHWVEMSPTECPSSGTPLKYNKISYVAERIP
jgi:hypothetical protein